MIEWLEHRTPRRWPGFPPQAALIAIRLTKLVVPPNRSSIARVTSFLPPVGVHHVKSSMIQVNYLIWLTNSSNHAINGAFLFCESYLRHVPDPSSLQTWLMQYTYTDTHKIQHVDPKMITWFFTFLSCYHGNRETFPFHPHDWDQPIWSGFWNNCSWYLVCAWL